MNTIRNPEPVIRGPIIYPVILAVPEKERLLTGREKVLFLSRYARNALEISARKQNILIGDLLKDDNGIPIPFNGNYWSLTHKPKYVGGVVATTRIGIDIEKIRPCSEALLRVAAGDREWSLSDEDSCQLFFRYWTSKEAVLKATGTGLKDLKKCPITQVMDDYNLVIDYGGEKWHIEHFFFDGHIASVVKGGLPIKWTLIGKKELEQRKLSGNTK